MSDFPRFRRAMRDEEATDLPVTIYALVDPRDRTARYIGQTRSMSNRFAAHASARDSGVADWIQELREASMLPTMKPIARCSADTADDAERYWIAFYRSLGRIYNVAPGGRSAAEKRPAKCAQCLRLRCARCRIEARRERDRQRPIVRDAWGYEAESTQSAREGEKG